MTTLHDDTFPLLLQLICTFLYRTLSPSPFSPGSLQPFLYSLPSSLPLLTQLPWRHVTMHVPAIADPDIAEVTRLASLLPIIIHSLLPLTATPSRDLHVTRPTPSGVPSHVCTLVSPTTILSRDSTMILSYLGSSRITTRSSDLLGNLRTFLLWLRSLLRSLRIYQDHLRIYLTHP